MATLCGFGTAPEQQRAGYVPVMEVVGTEAEVCSRFSAADVLLVPGPSDDTRFKFLVFLVMVRPEVATHLIEQLLKRMSDKANSGCGQVYELYFERFCSMVDAYCESECFFKEQLLMAARRDYGYLDLVERKDAESLLEEGGACIHGLDPSCCPVGCGDR